MPILTTPPVNGLLIPRSRAKIKSALLPVRPLYARSTGMHVRNWARDFTLVCKNFKPDEVSQVHCRERNCSFVSSRARTAWDVAGPVPFS
eukprot:12400005-Karenia_brevis.AAC.1